MVQSFGTSARIPNNLGAFRRVPGQDALPHHGHSEKQLLQLEEKALSAKELNRRKLAEARRREAEKYGEEYKEVTDEDLQ